MLSTLTQWSVEHIRDIFEAHSDEQSLRSIANTFADTVVATINGRPLNFLGIQQLVLNMRKSAPNGLKVQWKQTVEVPRDAETKRVGSLFDSD